MIHNSPHDIVVVGAKRTPQGKLLGALSSLDAVQLGAVAAQGAIESSGLSPKSIDAVIFGQVVQIGSGQNPARQTAINAGVPLTAYAVTINSVCLSGLRAVLDSARLLLSGDAQFVLAGGQESISSAPHFISGIRGGKGYGSLSLMDTIEIDALTDAFDHQSMGINTDTGNEKFSITREAQDAVALESHQRAAKAINSGVFDSEIIQVETVLRKGQTHTVSIDEGVRSDTSIEALSRLRPSFLENGSITAGNASPLSDGAAAVVLTTRASAESRSLPILATLRAWASVAGPDDTLLHLQPANAIRAAISKQNLDLAQIQHIEINEAFAAVSIASTSSLGINAEKVNPNGGAIALGHPVGASGARLVVHAAHQIAEGRTPNAAIALCGGGGQGDALILTR